MAGLDDIGGTPMNVSDSIGVEGGILGALSFSATAMLQGVSNRLTREMGENQGMER